MSWLGTSVVTPLTAFVSEAALSSGFSYDTQSKLRGLEIVIEWARPNQVGNSPMELKTVILSGVAVGGVSDCSFSCSVVRVVTRCLCGVELCLSKCSLRGWSAYMSTISEESRWRSDLNECTRVLAVDSSARLSRIFLRVDYIN